MEINVFAKFAYNYEQLEIIKLKREVAFINFLIGKLIHHLLLVDRDQLGLTERLFVLDLYVRGYTG